VPDPAGSPPTAVLRKFPVPRPWRRESGSKRLLFRKESCQGTGQDWNFPAGAAINQIGPPVAPAYP